MSRHHHDIVLLTWFACIALQSSSFQAAGRLTVSRFSSGVKVSVLTQSIYLRKKHDTFGAGMNNASIALRQDYNAPIR